MKKYFLTLLTAILCFNCYSQITFEKGYIINNANQRIEVEIKNMDWRHSPTKFTYRLSKNSEAKEASIKEVKEFGVYNLFKYNRFTVKLDRSSDFVSDMSDIRKPIFKEEQLFLKALIEGKADLYLYSDTNLKKYFYRMDDSDVEQLIYKRYTTPKNKIGVNNRFKQQLLNGLKCPSFKKGEFEDLEYEKDDMTALFLKYNKCVNAEFVVFEKKEKRDVFNLTLRPRLISSSLTADNVISEYRHIDFGNKLGFGFGIEAEYIFPFNKNKWALILEATYQSYKGKESNETSNLSGGKYVASVTYNSIEIPMGLRYYSFLSKKSKIFLNISYVVNVSFDSSYQGSRADGSVLDSFELYSEGNFAFGIGYKYNDRYSLEFRYQSARDVLDNYTLWIADYKSFSMIIGYTLF